MQEQVVGSDAGLAAVEALSPGDAAGGDLYVGIFVHYTGALASEFQHQGREVLGLGFHHHFSESRAAGEEHHVEAGAEQLRIDLAVALHHGNVPGLECVFYHLLEGSRHVGNVGRGLEDGCAAGGDGSYQRAQEQLYGIVPWRYDERASQGLAYDVAA